jgi:hypothetical protein
MKNIKKINKKIKDRQKRIIKISCIKNTGNQILVMEVENMLYSVFKLHKYFLLLLQGCGSGLI